MAIYKRCSKFKNDNRHSRGLNAALTYTKCFRMPVFPVKVDEEFDEVPAQSVPVNEAACSPFLVESLWKDRPDHYPALALGEISGLFVLSWAAGYRFTGLRDEWCESLIKKLPNTVIVQMKHQDDYYVLSYDPKSYIIRKRSLQCGIKILCDGSHIILPRDPYPEGSRAPRWLENNSIFNLNPAPAPIWLLDMVGEPPVEELCEDLEPKPTRDEADIYSPPLRRRELRPPGPQYE